MPKGPEARPRVVTICPTSIRDIRPLTQRFGDRIEGWQADAGRLHLRYRKTDHAQPNTRRNARRRRASRTLPAKRTNRRRQAYRAGRD